MHTKEVHVLETTGTIIVEVRQRGNASKLPSASTTWRQRLFAEHKQGVQCTISANRFQRKCSIANKA